MQATRMARALGALTLAALLTACGADRDARDAADRPAHPGPVAAQDRAAAQRGATDAVSGDVAAAQRGPDTAALPTVRDLEVRVEGQSERREASLFHSPQGYAIYVLPQLEITPEEPCCDLAWARVDDGFFLRIERIDPGADLATLRTDMELALSAVGPAEPLPPGALPPALRGTELALRARGDGVTLTMLVARIDGGRYRATLHTPHREAAEGITPSLWAMLGSLRTTGDWLRRQELE